MTRRTVGIVDYGVGNLASVAGAVREAGHRALVSSDRAILAAADLLILPGVGAFPPAMASLDSHGLTDFLKAQAAAGQPLLGICLGMQLLAERSMENGSTEGLGLIAGEVRPDNRGLRHIGWNRIRAQRDSGWIDGADGDFVYFNHSYYFRAANGAVVATASREGENGEGEIVAAVQRDHIVGVQFHPEKSQSVGRGLMERLVGELTA